MDLDWHSQANCNHGQHDPDDWWVEGTRRTAADDAREQHALAVCRSCPVIDACFEHGVVHEPQGVWGGTTAADRRELRRALQMWVRVLYAERRKPDAVAADAVDVEDVRADALALLRLSDVPRRARHH